jgi:hypothetical protein
MTEGLKLYIAQRSKAFAAGLSGAIITALIQLTEQSFGFTLDTEVEGLLVATFVGLISGITTYWSPANAPMGPPAEPKP